MISSLLSAALRVLEDPESEGKLPVRAVAGEAGVAPQSVYLQFPDAAALRWAAFARMFDVLGTELDQAIDKAPDPAGALGAWASAYIDFALGNPGRYQAMFGAVGEYQPQWKLEDLPGSTVFSGLQQLVSIVGGTEAQPDDSFTVALCLWSSLHGLASLRISKPSFPWPPLGPLVARVLDQHVGVTSPVEIRGG